MIADVVLVSVVLSAVSCHLCCRVNFFRLAWVSTRLFSPAMGNARRFTQWRHFLLQNVAFFPQRENI